MNTPTSPPPATESNQDTLVIDPVRMNIVNRVAAGTQLSGHLQFKGGLLLQGALGGTGEVVGRLVVWHTGQIIGRYRVLGPAHAPLARLPRLLTRRLVAQKALLFFSALKALGLQRPRVGPCALNPHAGDGGLLGGEELSVLGPAAAALRARGLDVAGPLPADSAWAGHLRGATDGLLCLYHDQALAPLKAAAAGLPAVHCTWGLPFIRVSPAHGTAFDIAGRGKADARGMAGALKFAARLARGQGT